MKAKEILLKPDIKKKFEAISKSNLIHYISSIQCVGKDVITTISFDSVKHCETEEEAKEFVKQICELMKNIKKENK